MGAFWIPEFKYQLVEWLEKYDSTTNWKLKSKKQLLAIYISIRKKGGYYNEKTGSVIQLRSCDSPSITHLRNQSHICSLHEGH